MKCCYFTTLLAVANLLVIITLINTQDIKESSTLLHVGYQNRSLTYFKSCKIKRCKSRTLYYSNHSATFQLILCGDVEANPGPTLRRKCKSSDSTKIQRKRKSSPCSICWKGVGSNRKHLICPSCFSLTHVSCSSLSLKQQAQIRAANPVQRLCDSCNLMEMPFYRYEHITSDIEENEIPIINPQPKELVDHVEILNRNRNQTSIAHLNAQSLISTFDEFSVMMDKYRFDVVCVTETWFTDSVELENYVQIPGYELIKNSRSKCKGGGAAIYIQDHLEFKTRTDIINIDTSIEHAWVEVKGKNKNSSFLVGCVYQPSSVETEKRDWCEKLDNLLSQIYVKWDGIIILTGDFNIDLLNGDPTTKSKYLNILKAFELKQQISDPTRKGKTLIDHISSNIATNTAIVIPADEISDHDLTYAILNIRKQKFETRYKWVRNEKSVNMSNYKIDFNQLPLNIVYAFEEPDDQINALNTLILECINRHAPLRRIKLTRPPAPWMADLNIEQTRVNLHNQRLHAQYTNNESDWEKYRNLRNTLKREIKSTKKTFFKKALLSKNAKSVWSTIHRILKPNFKRIKTKPKELNDYFSSIASKITGKTQDNTNNINFIQQLPVHNTDNQFIIRHTTMSEVRKLLLNLRNDCSTGHDAIPVRYIKPVADILVSPLTYVINNCIDKGIFPNEWKVARVCPIPKVKNPTELNEYRPISVLPILSKIFEKVILNQLLSFIETHNVYKTTQSGYRKGHSSISLLMKLKDDIQRAMNNNEVMLSVFADYSKAFDTVNYKILLRKLHALEFSKGSLYLINNYLTGRKQYVQIDDKRSPRSNVTCGVPQGSILGPILFNLYVHDLSDNTTATCLQFADDTTIYRNCKVKNIQQTATLLEEDLSSLVSWSDETNLIFNNAKTKSMIFSTPQMSRKHKLDSDNTFTINSGNESHLERVTSWKVLGIKLQENLNWNEHINTVVSDGYSTLRTLRKIKRVTSYHIRKNLVESLILSRIDYGNVIYKNITLTQLSRLQRLQNSAAGYVIGRYAKVNDVISLKWLPIKERIEFAFAKMSFKALNNDSWPEYLPLMKHERLENSRNKNKFVSRSYEKSTFTEESAIIYNDLPVSIHNTKTYSEFSSRTKSYFLDKALARVL